MPPRFTTSWRSGPPARPTTGIWRPTRSGRSPFTRSTRRRPADAGTIVEAASRLAGRHGSPRTQAWAAALASELHARAGREVASRRSLEDAWAAMDRCRADTPWKGVGWFDDARLVAYDGGSLLFLGKYAAAEELLRESL